MSATVMTADGTWSGTTGKADGLRDLQVDDQFAAASITKSVVAAQVMELAERGDLALDEPVAAYLPSSLAFDTNGATVRELLGHRSGIPDYYDLWAQAHEADPDRMWSPTQILALLPEERTPAGREFAYAETNYLLLELAMGHLQKRSLSTILREGVLAGDGLERLVHQPGERPTEPAAMPAGARNVDLRSLGGFLPSLSVTTALTASGSIASDASSLARWWQRLCSGQILSEASLTEMMSFHPAGPLGGYGLGVYNPAHEYALGFGHTGQLPGYMSWAACLPEHQAVVVVLTNHEVADGHFAFSHGLGRPLVDVLTAS